MSDLSIYTTGGTVGQGVYIRRRADGELFELCRQGEYVCMLTARQMGKSSAMVRVAQRLRAEAGHRTVLLDLTQFGGGDSTEDTTWYVSILDQVQQQLALPLDAVKWWGEQRSLTATHRFTQFFMREVVERLAVPVVVFIDEIDTLLSTRFAADFFAALRFLYTARVERPAMRRLSFVLIGTALPSDLVSDPRRTPFNVGRHIELTDFTLDEALPLAQGFGLTRESDARSALAYALDWTGGHPYLTQRLCRAMAMERRERWSAHDVERIVIREFLRDEGRRDNNLIFVRDMLTRQAPDQTSVLRLYRRIHRGRRVLDEINSVPKAHLRLSGVVKTKAGKLVVRNRIYYTVFDRTWIKNHLPIDWRLRFKQLSVGTMILFAGVALFGGISVFVYSQKRQLQVRTDQLDRLYQQLKKAENELTASRIEALRARDIAEEGRRRAEQEKRKAEAAKSDAEKANAAAVAARVKAELSEANLIQAQAQLVRSREEAVRKDTLLKVDRAFCETRLVELQDAYQKAEDENEKRKFADNFNVLLQVANTKADRLAVLQAAAPVLKASTPAMLQKLEVREGALLAVGAVAQIRQDALRYDSARMQRHGSNVLHMAFFGERFVTVAPDDPSLCLWSTSRWERLWCMEPDRDQRPPTEALAVGEREKRLLILDTHGRLFSRSWSGDQVRSIGHLTMTAEALPLRAAHISAGATRIIVLGRDRRVRVYSGVGFTESATVEVAHGATAIDVSTNGRWLAIGTVQGALHILDLATDGGSHGDTLKPTCTDASAGLGVALRTVRFPDGPSKAAPDQLRVVTAGPGIDIRVWNFSTNAASQRCLHELVRLGDHTGSVNIAALAGDGEWLAAGGNDGAIRLCDVELEAARAQQPDRSRIGCTTLPFEDAFVTDLAFSDDGRWLVAGGQGGVLRVYPMRPEEYLRASCDTLRAQKPEFFESVRRSCSTGGLR